LENPRWIHWRYDRRGQCSQKGRIIKAIVSRKSLGVRLKEEYPERSGT